MADPEFNLEPLLALQKLSRRQALERFSAAESDLEEADYEGMKGLAMLSNEETDPVRLYFKGDRLAVAYVGSQALAEGTKREVLRSLGDGATQLASRAGKASTLYVFPEKGVAFSASGQELEFLEVFQPTTLERYKAEIYEEPGPFIR